MELQVFHGITYGYLMPDPKDTIRILPSISTHLNDSPSSLEEAEDWIRTAVAVLSHSTQSTPLRFDSVPKTSSSDLFSGVIYTEIRDDIYPIELKMQPIGTTKIARLYSALFRWESYRIKKYLIAYAHKEKDDELIKKEVLVTLSELRREADSAVRMIDGPTCFTADSSTIYKDYAIALCKLYYEIAVAFDSILTGDEVYPVIDFCQDIISLFPVESKIETTVKAMYAAHRTQAAIAIHSTENNRIVPLKEELMKHIDAGVDLDALKPTFVDIDNIITINNISDVVDTKQPSVDDVIKEAKSYFKAQIEAEEVALDRINTIDEILKGYHIDGGISHPKSINSALQRFLMEQREFYASNPSARYPVNDKQKNEERHSQVQRKSDEIVHTPEVVYMTTRESEFRAVVAPFKFTEIPSVVKLTPDNQTRLIQNIVGKSVPYGVAMLVELGYDKVLQQTYKYNKTKIAKHWAECLNSNERTIRGNYNRLTNPDSTESRETYTSEQHADPAKQFYNSLL